MLPNRTPFLRSPGVARLVASAGVLLTALLLGAAPARAQVDLPASKKGSAPDARRAPARGDVAPYLVCTVCGERNYTTAIDWSAEGGFQEAWCGVCRLQRLHQLPRSGKERDARALDLPADARRPGRARPAPSPVPAAEPPAPDANEPGVPGAGAPFQPELGRAANAILDDLAREESLESTLVAAAPGTLLALGDAGISAARVALASDRGALVLTGVRVLLASGDPRDAESVARRVTGRLPARAAAQIVAEFVARDPVRATPRALIALLSHEQAPVRLAAQRALAQATLGPEHLADLALALRSSSSDTREKAVDLIAGVSDPGALDLLLDALDDARPEVARRAVSAVARRNDPRVVPSLLAAAFGERWILRSSAYALLAILEREEVTLEPILNAGHVEALLGGLEARDELVSAVSAAALAGIGFRTEDSASTPWLDGPVPARLVEVATGFEFFRDYESVRGIAGQRLAAITGQSFGSNGPAWGEWWLGVRDDFQALRAVLPAGEGAERRLRVALRDSGGDGAFVLLGPDEALSGAPARLGEAFYLSPEEAADLLAVLAQEQVLGVARLPGARGTRLDRGRLIEVSLDGRSKSFALGEGLREPWFERVFGVALSLRDRCLWQRYPDPARHVDRLGLYQSEGAWWSTHTDELERRERLKGLMLARLAAVPVAERDDTVHALLELCEEGGAAPEDLDPLLDLLDQELALGPRAARLAAAARRAAGLAAEPPANDAELAPEVAERAERLIGRLLAHFGEASLEAVGEVLTEGGRAFARAQSRDPRTPLRAVAALALGERPEGPDVERLLELLEDDAPEVEIAAVEALGSARVEAARPALLVRASLARPEVRSAALRAIGRLGGEDARDVLVTTLGTQEAPLRLSSAVGLAAMRDRRNASIFISLLRSDPDEELTGVLRQGLLQLGEQAHDELFAAVRSPSANLRREAALLLSLQSLPGAAPALMRVLAEDPSDTAVQRELCTLTCVDHRDATDPAEAWYRWWDEVRHDDSTAWLRAAAETRGIAAPPAEAFASGGTRDALGFLAQVMRAGDEFLAERARRELARLVGRDPGALPPEGPARDAWLQALLDVLDQAR